MEDESHVAFNFIFFESFSCFYTLPCGGKFDQYPWYIGTFIFVELNNPFGSINAFGDIERHFGINFSWNKSWNNF